MTTGLSLGKFAPLHKGHQMVIERGIAETDRFIVIIYDSPEVTSVPLSVRAGWLRTLYPSAQVLEAWDGPSEMGDTPEIKKLQEDYILKILDGRKVTHFYSSEFYGKHVSQALGARDCRVDPERISIPVSGTKARADLFGNRRHLDPVVYRDLITRVVFLGAPSTGKTTLCETLAKRFQTVWMPEYGREYWEAHQEQRRLTQEQLVEIAIGHREREDEKALEARDYLFVDTDATTTRIFSKYYHGASLPELDALADETTSRSDLVFLCGDDIPYDDTWDRSGEANRTIFQKQVRADLLQRKTSFFNLTGNLEDRVTRAEHLLCTYDKWKSLPENLEQRLAEL